MRYQMLSLLLRVSRRKKLKQKPQLQLPKPRLKASRPLLRQLRRRANTHEKQKASQAWMKSRHEMELPDNVNRPSEPGEIPKRTNTDAYRSEATERPGQNDSVAPPLCFPLHFTVWWLLL